MQDNLSPNNSLEINYSQALAKKVLVYSILTMLLCFCISSLLASLLPPTSENILIASGISSLLSFGGTSLFISYKFLPKRIRRSILGLKAPEKLSLPEIVVIMGVSLLFIASYYTVINSIETLTEKLTGNFGDFLRECKKLDDNRLERFMQGNNPLIWSLRILVISILAGTLEELFMRGLLQPSLIVVSNNTWLGMIATALIFALLHLSILNFLPIFIFGLFFAYLREKTGTIYIGMALHILNNLLILLLY